MSSDEPLPPPKETPHIPRQLTETEIVDVVSKHVGVKAPIVRKIIRAYLRALGHSVNKAFITEIPNVGTVWYKWVGPYWRWRLGKRVCVRGYYVPQFKFTSGARLRVRKVQVPNENPNLPEPKGQPDADKKYWYWKEFDEIKKEKP
jgi:hypothetical protein